VLDSVSSPITERVYNLRLDEFLAWFGQEPRSGFTKATVCAWRVPLEEPDAYAFHASPGAAEGMKAAMPSRLFKGSRGNAQATGAER
jgi:hypothetical protein